MDMGFVSRQLVAEMRAANPNRTITLEVSGDMNGEWDRARIGQVFSNLISNAIQYGFEDTSINVTVKGNLEEISLAVHNEGMPIPTEKMLALFSSFSRTELDGDDQPITSNLGLGLYITKEIAVSHGGTIDVSSSEKEGTIFTAYFPRVV